MGRDGGGGVLVFREPLRLLSVRFIVAPQHIILGIETKACINHCTTNVYPYLIKRLQWQGMRRRLQEEMVTDRQLLTHEKHKRARGAQANEVPLSTVGTLGIILLSFHDLAFWPHRIPGPRLAGSSAKPFIGLNEGRTSS